MKRSVAIWAVLVGMACTPSARPLGRVRVAPATDQASVVPEALETPPPIAEEQPELEIGVTRPARIHAAARNANREGLRRHADGDYEASLAAFEKAIAAQPEHDMARFNLACALGRLGRHAEATEALVEVLTRDPVRFRVRVRDDEDLDSLRRSPEWKSVEDHLRRVSLALDRAFDRGVPSMFFEHTRPHAGVGVPQQGGTRDLVLGLYLHDSRRFVPLSRGGAAAWVDAERRRVVRIDSTVWEGVVHSMWRSSTLSVTSIDATRDFSITADLEKDGPPALGVPDLMKDADNTGFELSFIAVPTGEGLWLELEWHTQGGEPYEERTKLELTTAGLHRTGREMPAQGVRIAFMYEGAVLYDPLPAGHSVDRRVYRAPGLTAPVKLSRGHAHARWQSAVLTTDGRFAIVTSIEQREGPRFEDSGFGILRHAVDRVDLSTGDAFTLAEGRGTARTVIAPDGSIYVQGGDETQRWSRADAAAPEAVTEGLRLAPPLDSLECGLCG